MAAAVTRRANADAFWFDSTRSLAPLTASLADPTQASRWVWTLADAATSAVCFAFASS